LSDLAVIEIEEMGGRNDDLDCDAYLTSTYNGQRESSNTQKSTLNPIFNESFYFSDVRDNPFIVIEVRDFKDGFLYALNRSLCY
jgi:Ca2+-dependent lipid-binding protein